MQVIVFAAGALGSTLGGLLALKKHDVTLVCRKAHADAINTQKGLRMKSATGDYFAEMKAVEIFKTVKLDDNACVFFTPKSNHTEACAKALSKCVPKTIPVISFQNGIANEELLTTYFTSVYGGVTRMTCSLLNPGQVTFRRIGRVVIGKYPKGTDAFSKKAVEVFADAGFQSVLSRSIMCDKWLKLIVNLQSALNAIIDPRDHESIEFMKLKVGIIEEAEKVLRADKIRAKSCDERDFSIDEMVSELKRPRAQRAASPLKVHNSTWQNLYLKKKEIENTYFHNPIIELARKFKIPVPFNVVTLEEVLKCHKKKLEPEALRANDILELVQKRATKQ